MWALPFTTNVQVGLTLVVHRQPSGVISARGTSDNLESGGKILLCQVSKLVISFILLQLLTENRFALHTGLGAGDKMLGTTDPVTHLTLLGASCVHQTWPNSSVWIQFCSCSKTTGEEPLLWEQKKFLGKSVTELIQRLQRYAFSQ